MSFLDLEPLPFALPESLNTGCVAVNHDGTLLAIVNVQLNTVTI